MPLTITRFYSELETERAGRNGRMYHGHEGWVYGVFSAEGHLWHTSRLRRDAEDWIRRRCGADAIPPRRQQR